MELKRPVHNILIFGDSYSTYEGYIPDGYAIYYRNVDCDNTDVRLVEETWWHRLCQEQKLHLVRNDSWSGSTIGNTGYNGDCSHSNSFLYRLAQLQEAQFFTENDIDTVFIFGGTNDSWSNAPLGADKKPPYTEEDLFCVCPAIWTFIERLQQTLPDANIISLINTELKLEIGECIRAASEHFDTAYITLHDIHKCCGHPTIQGMRDITDQIKAFLLENEAETALTFQQEQSEC